MADDAKPRAVSGEIMTDGAAAEAGRIQPSADVIDADYISLPQEARAEPRKPAESPAAIGSAAAPALGMDMLRKDKPPGPTNPVRGGPLFWATGIALVIASFWVSGGHALVREMSFAGTPQSALRISGVTSRIDATGTRLVLFVDGEAANDGKTTEHLPPLEIAVTGNDGLVTRYRLGTSGRPLAPGETFAFSSRLDAPKNGVKTVTVSFAE
ncbi:MAG: hypothetical protein JNK47_03755 [Mesorhizobium sp.]|nr:hypothetical protein [Mesorhizobium sp.]MBL8576316.1 hypothetical protein [Mesorhizobium sp.]